MKVLIACEYSGVSRRAFEALGHEVWSADFEPAEDGAANHYQGDCFDLINGQHWDLMVAHPPCTYFAVSSAWALQDPNLKKYPGVGYHQKVKPETLTGEARRKAQQEALVFVRLLLAAPIPRIAIENPVGQLSTLLRKPDQIIQPWWFGDDASKATCLWLKNLPLLHKTNPIPGRMVDGRERWGNQTDSGQNKLSPSEDRWKVRSRTYPGIAAAWAEQWGGL
jgi:hypothetical protein